MKGFTLIELMIVVAIIAILVAIAGPAYNDYIEHQRAAQAEEVDHQSAARRLAEEEMRRQGLSNSQ